MNLELSGVPVLVLAFEDVLGLDRTAVRVGDLIPVLALARRGYSGLEAANRRVRPALQPVNQPDQASNLDAS